MYTSSKQVISFKSYRSVRYWQIRNYGIYFYRLVFNFRELYILITNSISIYLLLNRVIISTMNI